MSREWSTVPVGDVLALDTNRVSVDPSVTYPMVGVLSFGRGLFDREPIVNGNTSYKFFYRLDPDHFVMSQLFGWEGALALSSEEFAGKYLSPQFPTFRCDSEMLDRGYLGWVTRRPSFWDQLGAKASGMGDRRRTLTPDALLTSKIPLPPLSEQRRIVARIEAINGKLEEARRIQEQVSQEASALHHSIVARLLTSSRTTNIVELPDALQSVRRGVEIPGAPNTQAAKWRVPSGWRRISIAELLLRGALVDVKDGNHGANHPRSSEFLPEGMPFLMASDLQDGKVEWGTASALGPDTISRLRVGFAREHDVLFTHKASIGRTAIADRDCILSPQVTYYRCNPNYIEPRWLQEFLGSTAFLSQLTDIQAQSTRDFVSISKQYQQFVMLPPITEQHRIVAEINGMNTRLQGASSLLDQTAAELDALLPAVLDKTFIGGSV